MAVLLRGVLRVVTAESEELLIFIITLTNAHIININYIIIAPKCFGALVPSSGSL